MSTHRGPRESGSGSRRSGYDKPDWGISIWRRRHRWQATAHLFGFSMIHIVSSFLIGVPVFLYLALPSCGGGLPSQRAFDSIEWQLNAHTEDGPTVRAHMIEDLFDNVLSSGLTREDVEALLGEPDTKSYSSLFKVPGWTLGSWDSKSLGRNDQSLLLKFNNGDELIAARAGGLVPFGTWP